MIFHFNLAVKTINNIYWRKPKKKIATKIFTETPCSLSSFDLFLTISYSDNKFYFISVKVILHLKNFFFILARLFSDLLFRCKNMSEVSFSYQKQTRKSFRRAFSVQSLLHSEPNTILILKTAGFSKTGLQPQCKFKLVLLTN